MTEESWGTTIDTRIAILSEAVRLAEALELELQGLGEAVQVRGTVPEGETTLLRQLGVSWPMVRSGLAPRWERGTESILNGSR